MPVVEVSVESRAANVGAINDVLYRECLKAIFLDQGHQGAEELPRPLDTAVIFFFLPSYPHFPNNQPQFVQ